MSIRPDDHRRKWNREDYENLALDRLRREIAEEELGLLKRPAVKRELLKHRDYKIDLDSKIGKSSVVKKTSSLAESGGYYCNVCDCVVKDSINFLDHVNGTKHQKIMGMSMKIDRSTLQQVRDRFAFNKRKMEEKKKEYDLEARLKELDEEKRKLKESREERKRDCKKRKALELEDNSEGEEEHADQITMIMGFSNFGSNK